VNQGRKKRVQWRLKKMDKLTALALVMGLLLVVTAIQTAGLNDLKFQVYKLSTTGLVASKGFVAAAAPAQAIAPQGGALSAVSGLPDMVGGC
jgi:hypothetical protein